MASLILEIAFGFILRFLGFFLSAYRVPLVSINKPVNTEKHTQDLGEELTALQGRVFRVYSFSLYFIMKMFIIKSMCN